MGGKTTSTSGQKDRLAPAGGPADDAGDSASDSAEYPPALGIVELSSIARGVVVSDAAVKQAPSLLLMSRPVSSGKHLVVMRGEVAEVEESMRVARHSAAERLIDSLELPFADEQLWPLLDRPVEVTGWDSDELAVAIVETATVCAAVGAADAAAKTAAVVLRDMRLAVGIAGKAFFTMTGELHDVEAAASSAASYAGEHLILVEVIAAPAAEIRGRLIF
ncbi:MAG: BMC domain-containing protein [Proteobacteria bacterium]|nr:BMC domain-containing protein [Pseudomonadota bacterium]